MEAYNTEQPKQDDNNRVSERAQDKAAVTRTRMQELHERKMGKSAAEFRNARVTSCSSVLLQNGKAVCVAFPTRKKTCDINAQKSSETKSLAL